MHCEEDISLVTWKVFVMTRCARSVMYVGERLDFFRDIFYIGERFCDLTVR